MLVERGEIVAARLDWPGPLAAGLVEDALLIARHAGSPRGTLRFASGEEALIDGLERNAREGAPLRAIVTRSALAERGRLKRAQARPSQADTRPAPGMAESLKREGHQVHVVRSFADADWDDLFAEAWSGTVDFTGGSLTLSPTPAMTLIDIDGTLAPAALALAAVPAIAATLRRMDLAGSVGIDFPSLAEKSDRRALDEALAAALVQWQHQRTAMNGFGFVQLVARLERASLLARLSQDRTGAAARLLLRRAEQADQPGALLLTAHPAVLAAIPHAWEVELARRSGRIVRRSPDPALALDGGFAQAVAT